MNIKYTYTRLLVDDFKGCFKFYSEVMGFPVTWGQEDEDYAEFDSGATRISINMPHHVAEAVGTTDKPFKVESQDQVVLIFEVDDVDSAFKELVSRGAISVTEPQDRPGWGIRTAHFRDPSGNLIEINHALAAED